MDFTLSLLSLQENRDPTFFAYSSLFLCIVSVSKGVIYFYQFLSADTL